MEKIIAGKTIHVNEEGYLTALSEWDKSIASEIAKEEGVGELGDRHWQVIEYLQGQFKQEIPLSIRKIGKSGVVGIEEFYALFPQGPLKKASKIAGIPKPASCI
ncbi:MAG: TusE/DsrC/DsvC family sulfur relay protein [Chitinophagaceae bacterium]|nr:TusE/DsrC/DsvC family sulfur relay protein [Chitinophagaceae bacterium]MBL0334515.1 TusE/DsrC/DsvC family sulfur relay protein [Chitinophagaceae bacterium]